MLQSAAETHLSIIYNCARNYPLPEYYCTHAPWAKIISVWENSCNDGLRITCKLLANTISMFLDQEHLHLLDMSDSDILSLSTALHAAASSPDSTAQAFGYSYSILELLKALLYVSCTVANFSKVANPPMLAILTSIVQTGQLEEKIVSLRLLWSFVQLPELKAILELSHADLLERLVKESALEGVLLWSEGICAHLALSPVTNGK